MVSVYATIEDLINWEVFRATSGDATRHQFSNTIRYEKTGIPYVIGSIIEDMV